MGLTLLGPAVPVMQGWEDCGLMGCSFSAAHTSHIHPPRDFFAIVIPQQSHFTQDIKVPINPFCTKSAKHGYNWVPQVGTERVKQHYIMVICSMTL